jgi:L-alanine-DL-glutamate epimerase-like enolase superfamily enzyme
MRVPSIELVPFSLSLADPLETAHGAIEAREGFLVVTEDGRSENGEGTFGIGEATPLPGWTESLAACEGALNGAIGEFDRSTGKVDPQVALREALDTLDAGETPAARHGFAAALADCRARQERTPLYRQLGGSQRVERVPVNATIGDGTPEEAGNAAEEAIDEGFECLKLKVGVRAIEADVARLRAIRTVVPGANAGNADVGSANDGSTNVEIRADANGAWSLAEARRALAAFEAEGGLAYVEQPLSATDLAGHAALRKGSSIEIALDETLSEHSPEAVLDREAADVLICKPMALGGLDRTQRVALRARAAGVRPVITTTIDGAIGRAGATHLAASLAPISPCGLATASLLETDLVGSDPVAVTNGYVAVPQGSGTIEATTAREAVDGSGA